MLSKKNEEYISITFLNQDLFWGVLKNYAR